MAAVLVALMSLLEFVVTVSGGTALSVVSDTAAATVGVTGVASAGLGELLFSYL